MLDEQLINKLITAIQGIGDKIIPYQFVTGDISSIAHSLRIISFGIIFICLILFINLVLKIKTMIDKK